MKLISVNVGQPRTVEWQGRMVETSIFKAPVALRTLNLNCCFWSVFSPQQGENTLQKRKVHASQQEQIEFMRCRPDPPAGSCGSAAATRSARSQDRRG